jgi:hypothetical protein
VVDDGENALKPTLTLRFGGLIPGLRCSAHSNAEADEAHKGSDDACVLIRAIEADDDE